MGQKDSYTCRKCGFNATLGITQPFFIMSGSILEKYCPATNSIVSIFHSIYDQTTAVNCQDKNWQENFGVPALCLNCKGECLKELETLCSDEYKNVSAYKCPCCGNALERDFSSIMFVD